jgi:hypothetical protein
VISHWPRIETPQQNDRLTLWYQYGTIMVVADTPERNGMPKRKKKTLPVVQSSMRLPRLLWEVLNRVADDARLSMAQAVERAVAEYCFNHATADEWLLLHEAFPAYRERIREEHAKKVIEKKGGN